MESWHAVPVLASHAIDIGDNDDATGDHVAFARDLASIDAIGFTVVALSDVVDALLTGSELPRRSV